VEKKQRSSLDFSWTRLNEHDRIKFIHIQSSALRFKVAAIHTFLTSFNANAQTSHKKCIYDSDQIQQRKSRSLTNFKCNCVSQLTWSWIYTSEGGKINQEKRELQWGWISKLTFDNDLCLHYNDFHHRKEITLICGSEKMYNWFFTNDCSHILKPFTWYKWLSLCRGHHDISSCGFCGRFSLLRSLLWRESFSSIANKYKTF